MHRGGQARDANRRASETRRRISRRFGDVSDLHPGLSSAGWSASKRTRGLDEAWKRRIDRIRCVRGRRDSKPSPKVDTCTVRCEGLRSTRVPRWRGERGRNDPNPRPKDGFERDVDRVQKEFSCPMEPNVRAGPSEADEPSDGSTRTGTEVVQRGGGGE